MSEEVKKRKRTKERRLDELKMASNDGLDVHGCLYHGHGYISNLMEFITNSNT